VTQSAQSRSRATGRDLLRLFVTRKALLGPDATVARPLCDSPFGRTRAEGCSDVEFRRISMQAIARGVSTTCPENPMRGSSHTYVCALRAGAQEDGTPIADRRVARSVGWHRRCEICVPISPKRSTSIRWESWFTRRFRVRCST